MTPGPYMADSPAAKRARTASSPKLPTPSPPAWISTLLPKSTGCGPVKRNALAAVFVDEPALRAASLNELQNVGKVGPTVATKVYAFLTGAPSSGVPVIEMWNTLTKQKCARGSVPKTEDEVEAWLAEHPRCERYDGQDQEGPRASDYVPDDDQLSRDKFVAHVGDNGAGLSEALAQVVETAEAYNLVVGPVYDDDGAPANTDNVAALFHALSHANVVNGELDGRTLQGLVADELAKSKAGLSLGLRGGTLFTTQLTDVLDAMPATLGRPLWAVMSVSGRPAVYLLAGPESQAGGGGPDPLAPLRIAYLGGRKFAPLFAKADLADFGYEVDESGIPSLPAPLPLPAAGTGNEGSPAGDTQLPELKSALREALDSTLACLDDIQEWSIREARLISNTNLHVSPR